MGLIPEQDLYGATGDGEVFVGQSPIESAQPFETRTGGWLQRWIEIDDVAIEVVEASEVVARIEVDVEVGQRVVVEQVSPLVRGSADEEAVAAEGEPGGGARRLVGWSERRNEAQGATAAWDR